MGCRGKRELGGDLGQADAAVVEEAGEQLPTPEDVIHRLGHRGMARQLPAFRLHPVLEVGQGQVRYRPGVGLCPR